MCEVEFVGNTCFSDFKQTGYLFFFLSFTVDPRERIAFGWIWCFSSNHENRTGTIDTSGVHNESNNHLFSHQFIGSGKSMNSFPLL